MSRRHDSVALPLPPPEAPAWADARARHARGGVGDAELACTYVAERLHRAAGAKWRQAPRKPPLVGDDAPSWLRLVAERELFRIPPSVPEALVAWSRGARPVDLFFHVPAAREILALQARARRCVSLLDEGVPTAPHEDGLAFAVHDLCHLEKFMNAEHHRGQVGFFALLEEAIESPRWGALEAPFDATWAADRDYVMSDMNGSAAFLFIALRGKLKLAVRRAVARGRGEAREAHGALDAEEARAFDERFETMLDLLRFEGEGREAARGFSSRSEGGGAALVVGHFEARAPRV